MFADTLIYNWRKYSAELREKTVFIIVEKWIK